MIEIKKSDTENIHVIEVKGDADASSSIHLDNAMEEAFDSGKERILIDLTGLEYISSAGLGVFISRLDEIKEKNVQMVLFGLSESVMSVFKILGLEKLLVIVDTKEQAIEAVNAS
jgi:anti-sigma B factor antagonist